MKPEISSEPFFVELNNKQYKCLAIKANDRMLYKVDFNNSCLYVTKAINQHGIPFWTVVPQDAKLRAIAYELGRQIEKHIIDQLCATTTVSK